MAGTLKCELQRGARVRDLMKQAELHFGHSESNEIILSIFYTVVGMIAVTGNMGALYFFYKIDKRFTTSKIFYSTFALIDLVIGVVSCWCGFIFAKMRPVIYCSLLINSKFFLNLFGLLETFTMFSSTNIIALMSVSRCVSVLLPFRFRYIFTPKKCYLMIVLACIHPLLMSFLPYFTSTANYQFQLVSGQTVYRYSAIVNETGIDQDKTNTHLINIFLSLLPRILSFGTTVVCSILVAVHLIQNYRHAISASDPNKAAQKNASITLIILATIYFVTYMPFCVFIIMDVAGQNDKIDYNITYIWAPCVYLVAYLNSAINPFVYHLRGRNIFESKPRGTRGTVLVNNNTRMSIIKDDKV